MIKHLFENLIYDTFCPRHCVRCARVINDFRPVALCADCEKLKTVPKIERSDKFAFDGVAAALKYDDNVRWAMLKYKFKSCKYYGAAFEKCMADAFGDYPFFKDSLVCCVPVSRSRNRAYSQTAVIARELCRLLDLPFAEDLILKVKDIAPLSSMTREQRIFSIKGVFDVNPSYDIFGKNIVVTDDIFTSGSTANECALTLKSHGASSVWVACACYD